MKPVDREVPADMAPEGGPRVLGWDAACAVRAVDAEAGDFAEGDRVFRAGDLTRAGADAAPPTVDHRIVGRAAAALDFVDAAAPPLTAIAAREVLFDLRGTEALRRPTVAPSARGRRSETPAPVPAG